MFPPLFGLSTGFQHGARQLWAIAVLQRVLAAASISQKQAAAIQELSPPQWALQASCREGAHVSFQRLFELPKHVLRALWIELLKEHDDVVVVEQAQLQHAVDVCMRLAEAVDARQPIRVEASTQERLSA